MPKHPDTIIGAGDAEGGASVQVMVGVDVRLDILKPQREPTVVLRAPDDAINLVGLFQRALEIED